MRPSRIFIFAAAAAATLLTGIPTLAQAQSGLSGFSVSPALIRAEVVANRVGTLRIQIDNFEQAPMNLTLRFKSIMPENGSYRLKFGVQHPNDASGWFLKPEQQLTVAPNGRANIAMQFKTPPLKAGAYWCMAELVPRVGNARTTFVYQVPIYLYLGRQARPDIKLSSPTLVLNGRRAAVGVPVDNIGDGMVTLAMRVDIRDANSGRVVQRLEDVDRDLYPKTNRVVLVEARPIPDGNYTLIATTRIGLKNFQPMQQSVSVRNGKVSVLSPNATFGLAAMTFNPDVVLKMEPAGSRRTYAVSVTNGTEKPATINLSVGTLSQLANGSYQVSPGKPVGINVSVSPASVDVPAKGSRTFKVVVEIPADARGDRWFGILAQPDGGSTMAEQLIGRITIPNSADPKMTLKSLGIEKIGGVSQNLTVEMTNKGNTALMPLATAVVLKDGIRIVADIEVPRLGDGGILPGSTLQNKLPLPLGLPPGNYLVSVTYQYGETLKERVAVPLVIAAQKKPAVKPAKAAPKKGAKN